MSRTDQLLARAEELFLRQNHNCAEAVYAAAAEVLGTGSADPAVKRALGAFGGGLSSGSFCGALAGAAAFLGERYSEGLGHDSPAMGARVRALIESLAGELGSTDCAALRPVFRSDERKCMSLLGRVLRRLAEITAQEC